VNFNSPTPLLDFMYVVRFGVNGGLDMSFNLDGERRFEAVYGIRRDGVRAMALDGAGAAYFAGFTSQNATNREFAVARMFLESISLLDETGGAQGFGPGRLDVRFGAGGDPNVLTVNPSDRGGVVVLPANLGGTNSEVANAILALPDGTLLVGGTAASASGNIGLLQRVNSSNGQLVTTYSGDGKLELTLFSSVTGLAAQLDGRILVAGTANFSGVAKPIVARLNPDGSFDSSFAFGGIRGVDLPASLAEGRFVGGVAIHPTSGKIALASAIEAAGATENDVAVVQLLGDPVNPAGTFNWELPGYPVPENVGVFTFRMVRIGGTNGQITVGYAFGSGTAVVGVDYAGFGTSVTFNDGEVFKDVQVAIADRPGVQGDRTFGAFIMSTTGGAGIGLQSQVGFLIQENDTPVSSSPRITGVSTFRNGRRQLTSLSIQVDSLLDPASVANLASYNLRLPGRDRRFGTRDDRIVRFQRVTYDPTANLIVLVARRPFLTGPRTGMRLTVLGTLIRAANGGALLDGDGDGNPGGNFVSTFVG
jgi:hypothetical protein